MGCDVKGRKRDGMGRDGVAWDGMWCDGLGWVGMGWGELRRIGLVGMGCGRLGRGGKRQREKERDVVLMGWNWVGQENIADPRAESLMHLLPFQP